MPRTDTIRGSTLCDSSRIAAAPEQSRLVFVGSPEDGFRNAGRCFPLAGLRRVEFRRAAGGVLSSSIDDGVLRIGMPHPWVSSHHADLELDGKAELVDLESRNGTLLEGDMIERAVLHSGDIFEVGRCFFALRQTQAPVHASTSELQQVAHPDYAARMHALERLAPTRVPLLLIGDTGTGKSALAQALHRATGRGGPFVALNMMARSVEPSLLGEGDALLGRARGGTLFLDDVGALSTEEQGRLLSALLGFMLPDSDALHLPEDGVRVIAAASSNLHRRAAEATFRPDLYARLAGYECRIPPLRERPEDLGLLVRRIFEAAGVPQQRIKVDVFRTMLAQEWPFNVRELNNCVSAALALCEDAAPITAAIWREVQWPNAGVPAAPRLASVRETIIRELAAHRGDKNAAAKSLGCAMVDIDRWLSRFDLVPEQFAS
ncbi:MAG: sigma 54-interacting transcriptional regulator [Nannocystales bacterium]